MDGYDYQGGSIEQDGNRWRNSETIQDEEIIISRTSQLQLLEGKIEGRRSRARPRTTWITDLTNNTVLPAKDSS